MGSCNRPHTYQVIESLLNRYKVEEQAYKGCLSLLKPSDKYTATRLENACALAITHVSKPGYKNIRLILQSGQDTKKKQKPEEENLKYALTRRKEYYENNK